MSSRLALALAFMLVSLTPSVLQAQEAKSGDLAKQLAQLLDAKKMESFAAVDAQSPDSFFATLYFPGTQLIVVAAKYSAPAMLTDLLARKDYRGVYTELASASIADSRLFVMDTYADGLAFKPSGQNAPDSVDSGKTHATFDGDWKKAKISETDYTKMFSDCDAAYTRALQGLVNSLKSSGTLH
jgi:hypothetical protein